MRRILREETGFTIVETLVAAVIMVGALFAMVALVDRASSSTAANAAREGGTSLAREVVETSRSVSYASLSSTSLPAALQAKPGLADAVSGGAYTVSRRGVTYTIAVTGCAVDDVKDGYGSHSIDATFCSDQTTTGTTDKNADDGRRVSVTVSWESGGKAGSSTQTTVVNNPLGALGPSITSLTMSTLLGQLTNPLLELASFNATTSTSAARVAWSIDGVGKGDATGGPTSWNFSWPLLNGSGTVLVKDGAYRVQARAYDSYGRSGATQSIPINLNRFAPATVTGVAGGRNGTSNDVDVEWDPNTEGDVVGYRVYRSLGPLLTSTLGPKVCETAVTDTNPTSCTDTNGTSLLLPTYYTVVALDKNSSGALRESTIAVPITIAAETVLTPQAAPSTPTGLSVCVGNGTSSCTLSNGDNAPSGTRVLTWTKSTDSNGTVCSYRIYRDGTSYASRNARAYPPKASSPALTRCGSASDAWDPGTYTTLKWADTSATSSHSYRVTAVDNNYKESAQAGPVTG